MEFFNVLREEPLIAWFVFLALLVTVVPAVSLLWRRISGQPVAAAQPLEATKSTRFGNQAELVVLFLGVVLFLAVTGWIASTFFA
jgi:hypothetical protein